MNLHCAPSSWRGDVGFARDKFSAFFSGERHKQNDFDLTPTTFDTTAAGFHRYNGLAKIKNLGNRATVTLGPTNFYQVTGNPNLRTEYAHSVQVGGEFTSRNRHMRFGVNLFRSFRITPNHS
jgi:hypothetical protein